MSVDAMLFACMLQAAQAEALPPQLLVSVMKVEGGGDGVAAQNTNRTEDLGLMQINTGAWLDLVARAHFHGDQMQAYLLLRDNGCYNLQVGAWILRRSIDLEGGNVWQGVGRYHSATPALKDDYLHKVQRAYWELFIKPQ